MKNLKKNIALIFLSLAFATTTLAQETRTYAGLDLGMNVSSSSVEKLGDGTDSDEKSEVIPQFRFNITHEFTTNVFLKTGVGYITHKISYETLSNDISLKYLELPIQIGYKIPTSDVASLGIFAGPYFGWGVGGKIKDEKDTFGKKGFDIFNYGAGIGIGFEVQSFAISLGYNHGIKDISGKYTERAIRLRSFYATLGINF